MRHFGLQVSQEGFGHNLLDSLVLVYGQVPQTGLFSFVKALLEAKLLGSEGIIETHYPVRSWLKVLA